MKSVQTVFGKGSFSCRAEAAFSIPLSLASVVLAAGAASSKEIL